MHKQINRTDSIFRSHHIMWKINFVLYFRQNDRHFWSGWVFVKIRGLFVKAVHFLSRGTLMSTWIGREISVSFLQNASSSSSVGKTPGWLHCPAEPLLPPELPYPEEQCSRQRRGLVLVMPLVVHRDRQGRNLRGEGACGGGWGWRKRPTMEAGRAHIRGEDSWGGEDMLRANG